MVFRHGMIRVLDILFWNSLQALLSCVDFNLTLASLMVTRELPAKTWATASLFPSVELEKPSPF